MSANCRACGAAADEPCRWGCPKAPQCPPDAKEWQCRSCGGDALWCRCTSVRITERLKTATPAEAYAAGLTYGETIKAREAKRLRQIRIREDEDV